jgi:putative membrane protein
MLVRPDRTFPGTFFMFRGSALQHIWPYLLFIFLASAVTTTFHEDWNLSRFSLTTTPFSLIGLALSIFLGFRNNACYDRWWEARKLWGALINTTRSLARQIHTLADDGRGFDRWEAVRKVVVYVYALKAHLRQEDVLASLAGMLTLEERQQLKGRNNVPVALLEDLG